MAHPQQSSSVSPSVLLTAIPGLLGFVPERSLVLLAFGDTPQTVESTMRHDLVLDDGGEPAAAFVAVLCGLADICARHEVRAVVAVIVDDAVTLGDRGARTVCRVVDEVFAAVGGLSAGFVVPAFVEGGSWRTVWEPRPGSGRSAMPIARSAPVRGRLGDPHSSPTAIDQAVRSGRRVLARRSEMAAMLEPAAHCSGTHHDPALAAAEVADLGDAELLRALITEVTAGRVGPRREAPWMPDCATTTMLGAALLRHPVRDAALALAVTDFRHHAEAMWRGLTRSLRGSARASAATMLAHLHYLGGEGGYAGVALDCALAADPDWSLAVLLDRALRNGVRPQMLWAMIDDSYDIADRLGVRLPPPTVTSAAG